MGRRNNRKPNAKSQVSRSNGNKSNPDNVISQVSDKFINDNSSVEETKKDSNSKTTRKSNDPAWYNYSPEQVAAVANIAFSEPLGEIMPMVPEAHWEDVDETRNVINRHSVNGIPGLMVLRTRPSFGYSLRITDPLNVSATELYVHVRYNNNGRKNYDASDLMMHTLAISDLYSLIMFIKKVYAAAFEYSNRNYYLGRNLLRALGFDPKDIVSNLANLRYWLNTFINKVEAYVVPGSINLFKRRAFLYADVYTESEVNSIKDQMYTFMPDGFFKFKFDDDEGGLGAGMLDYIEWPGSNSHQMTFTELVDYAEGLFENITQDEDFGLMSGDILKAFGNDIITVEPLPGEYYLEPHYDHEVLHQIMNASMNLWCAAQYKDNTTIQPTFASYDGDTKVDNRDYKAGRIYQTNKGVLIFAFMAPSSQQTGLLARWLDMYRNTYLNTDTVNVTTDEVMEMTRLTTAYVDAPSNWKISGFEDDPVPKVLSCGSDILVSTYVVTVDDRANAEVPNSSLSIYLINSDAIIHEPDNPMPMMSTSIKILVWQTQFQYAPQMIQWRKTLFRPDPAMDEQVVFHVESILQNLQNYTFISRDQLDRIHRVAMYSLVHVPGVTKLLNS